MKRKTERIWRVFLAMLLAWVAGCGTRPAASSVATAPGASLKCSFSSVEDGSVRVKWEFRNASHTDVWLPVKFDVTFGKPATDLPFFFLVPGGRIMAVSGLFSEWPPRLGIEEGHPEAELVCVSPGQGFAGERVLKLPFTGKDPPDHERPNPFTPWGAGNEVLIEARREEKVSGFQMAVQVFRLPEALVADYKKERFAGRDRIVVSTHPWWDTVKQSVACGRYWAVCLSQVENRSVETTDFADWVLSPVYRAQWPVGSHPPVGLWIGDKGGLLE